MTADTRAVLAGVKAFGVCFLLFVALITGWLALNEQVKPKPSRPDPLTAWSTTRILAELGEAAQVAGCEQFLGETTTGLTGRVWVHDAQRRILLVCTER